MKILRVSTNFLDETKAAIEANGHRPSEVVWCGSANFGFFTWSKFQALAGFYYSPHSSDIEIASDLLVVGDGWLLFRESDASGFEWWGFVDYKKPATRGAVTTLRGVLPLTENTLTNLHNALDEQKYLDTLRSKRPHSSSMVD